MCIAFWNDAVLYVFGMMLCVVLIGALCKDQRLMLSIVAMDWIILGFFVKRMDSATSPSAPRRMTGWGVVLGKVKILFQSDQA